MIVFDLRCVPNDHVFEGWFGSTAEYEEQCKSGILTCPFCNSADVKKAVMAPNISAKGNQSKRSEQSNPSPVDIPKSVEPDKPDTPNLPAPTKPVSNSGIKTAELKRLVAELAKVQKKALENSTWVGNKFADKARAIHYGDEPAQQIHGSATMEDAKELDAEGVEIAALPLPIIPEDQKH